GGDRGRSGAADGLQRGAAARRRPAVPQGSGDVQDLLVGGRRARELARREPLRRLRLREGLPGGEILSRREDRPDLRGHVEPAAADDREADLRIADGRQWAVGSGQWATNHQRPMTNYPYRRLPTADCRLTCGSAASPTDSRSASVRPANISIARTSCVSRSTTCPRRKLSTPTTCVARATAAWAALVAASLAIEPSASETWSPPAAACHVSMRAASSSVAVSASSPCTVCSPPAPCSRCTTASDSRSALLPIPSATEAMSVRARAMMLVGAAPAMHGVPANVT